MLYSHDTKVILGVAFRLSCVKKPSHGRHAEVTPLSWQECAGCHGSTLTATTNRPIGTPTCTRQRLCKWTYCKSRVCQKARAKRHGTKHTSKYCATAYVGIYIAGKTFVHSFTEVTSSVTCWKLGSPLPCQAGLTMNGFSGKRTLITVGP